MEMYEQVLCLGKGGAAEVFLMRHVERKKLHGVKRIRVEASSTARTFYKRPTSSGGCSTLT